MLYFTYSRLRYISHIQCYVIFHIFKVTLYFTYSMLCYISHIQGYVIFHIFNVIYSLRYREPCHPQCYVIFYLSTNALGLNRKAYNSLDLYRGSPCCAVECPITSPTHRHLFNLYSVLIL